MIAESLWLVVYFRSERHQRGFARAYSKEQGEGSGPRRKEDGIVRAKPSHAVRVELYELIGDRTFVSCSLAVGSRSTAFLGSAFGAGWEWWWWWW